MKKRLLIIFSIFLVVVLLVIIGSTIFTVQNAEVYFYNEEGKMVAGDTNIVPSSLIDGFKGTSIFFLSEKALADKIHSTSDFYEWYVVGVTRSFPSTVAIHLSKRIPVFFISTGGLNFLLDIFGYGTSTTTNSSSGYIDISKLSIDVDSVSVGKQITWKNEDAKNKFQALITVVSTIWRFNYNYSEVYTFIKDFSFSGEILNIYTNSGVKIEIFDPMNNLDSKFISAVSVYNSDTIDMTAENVVITVDKKGRVTSTSDKK